MTSIARNEDEFVERFGRPTTTAVRALPAAMSFMRVPGSGKASAVATGASGGVPSTSPAIDRRYSAVPCRVVRVVSYRVLFHGLTPFLIHFVSYYYSYGYYVCL